MTCGYGGFNPIEGLDLNLLDIEAADIQALFLIHGIYMHMYDHTMAARFP